MMLHFDFPNDRAMRRIRYELFMLGEALMVAPALEPRARAVRVPLPPGQWAHLWSEATFAGGGGPVTIPAPLGSPAVLYRPGSPVGARLREELERAGV